MLEQLTFIITQITPAHGKKIVFYIAQSGVRWKVSSLPTLGFRADSLALTSHNTSIGAY